MSSSSGEEVLDSPTVKPSGSLLHTPNKIQPYSQDKVKTSGVNLFIKSATPLAQAPIDRKRAVNSMPSSAQKRAKISEEKEISSFKLTSALKSITPRPKEFSVQSKTEILEKTKETEEEKEQLFDKPQPNLITYVRKKPWDEAKKYEMEAMVQIHSTFYEGQREQFHALRQTSNVIFLRKFNNWIKSVLINQTCYAKGKWLSVLDIWCGKGGDLQKWQRNKVSHYVAVDLSENSVRNASERFKQMKYNGRLPFHAIFLVNNVGDSTNSFHRYLDKRIWFDVVSCQMSMHYLCESEKTARTFLSNVSSKLVPGGFFIGTTLDANVLFKKLRKIGWKEGTDDKYTYGNQYYSCKFLHRDFPRRRAFGIKYLFYLEDGVGK